MEIHSGIIILLAVSLLTAGVANGGTRVESEIALKKPKGRIKQFEQKVVRVTRQHLGFAGVKTNRHNNSASFGVGHAKLLPKYVSKQ